MVCWHADRSSLPRSIEVTMGGRGSGRPRENPLCPYCGGYTVDMQQDYISSGNPGSHIKQYKCQTTGCREVILLDVLEGCVVGDDECEEDEY